MVKTKNCKRQTTRLHPSLPESVQLVTRCCVNVCIIDIFFATFVCKQCSKIDEFIFICFKSVTAVAMSKPVCCVLLPAAGVGSRMGSQIPKQFCEVLHRPIVSYTIQCFER